MDDNYQHTPLDPYTKAIEPLQEELPRQDSDMVDALQPAFRSTIKDDGLCPSLEPHYTLSSEYPATLNLSSSADSLSSNHGLIASYQPVPAPTIPFILGSAAGPPPSSNGNSSSQDQRHAPGTEDGSGGASPDRCAQDVFPLASNQRDDPESDNSFAGSLHVNNGSASSTDDEADKRAWEPEDSFLSLDAEETEAAVADLMRLQLGASMVQESSAPRTSLLDDRYPMPAGRRGTSNTPRTNLAWSARRSISRFAPAETYPYPQRGTRQRMPGNDARNVTRREKHHI